MGLVRAKEKESGNFNMVGIIIKWNNNTRLRRLTTPTRPRTE